MKKNKKLGTALAEVETKPFYLLVLLTRPTTYVVFCDEAKD